MLAGKRCTRLSKSDIRVQIVHSDHNATRSNDDEEDVKEPMVNVIRHTIPISAIHTSLLVLESSEVAFFLKLFKCARRSPQAPNSSESPGTSRTEHSDLLEEEEDERSDIKVKKKLKILQAKQRERANIVYSAVSIRLPIDSFIVRLI